MGQRETQQQSWDFFVSYTCVDHAQAGWITWVLREAGFRTLFQRWDFVPGMNWVRKIDQGTQATRTIAVLSPDYVKSKWARVEWQQAFLDDPEGVKRKLIAIRIADFKPEGIIGQAVWIDLVGADEDESRQRILDGVTAAVEGHAIPSAAPAFQPVPRQPAVAPLGLAVDPAAEGVEVPDVPVPSSRFVPRPQLLDRIRDVLVAPSTTRATPTVALIGMGGSGKSTIARAVAEDEAVRTRYRDGVVWLDIGPSPDPVACQARLAAALGDSTAIADVASGQDRLRALLTGTRRLIVLDDVWDDELPSAFDVGVPSSTLLITARDRSVAGHDVAVCPVDLLDDELGRRVLASWARVDPKSLPAEAESVLAGCGGLALALAAAGALVADGLSWSTISDRLRQVDLRKLEAGFPDYPAPDLMAAFDVSIGALPAEARGRYLQLAVFEGKGSVPVGAARLLWWREHQHETDSEEELVRLARRSLVRLDPTTGTFTLHDLQFGYARSALGTEGLAAAHDRFAQALLGAWGGLELGLPATASRLFGQSQTDRYGLAHLVEHLGAAGAENLIHALLAMEGSFFTAPGERASGNLWFAVHDRWADTATYLRDVHTARRLAEETTDRSVNPDEAAHGISLEIRYALVIGSVVSMAGNIPTWLLPALVEDGLCTHTQALSYARSMSSGYDRAQALAGLLPLLAEAQRSRVAAEALVAIRASGTTSTQVHILDELAPYVSERQRQRFIDDLLVETRNAPVVQRATDLLSLVDAVPDEQRDGLLDEALVAARTVVITANPYAEAEVLTKIAERTPARQRPRVLAEALAAAGRVDSEHLRSSLLLEIAAQQPRVRRLRLLAQALRAARHEERPAWQATELAAVAECVSPRKRHKLLAEALTILRQSDASAKAFALPTVIHHLPEPMLPAALDLAATLEDPYERSFALAVLAGRLPEARRGQALNEALSAAMAVEGPRHSARRGEALARVAVKLPADRRLAALNEALAAARGIADHERLISTRAALASKLPEPRRTEVLDEAAEAARRVGEPSMRLTVLQQVAAHTPPPRNVELLSAALDIAADVEEHYSSLARLTPDLPAELADRAFEAIERMDEVRDGILIFFSAQALVGLVDWIADESLGNLAARLVSSLRFDPKTPNFHRLTERMSADQVSFVLNFAAELLSEHGEIPVAAAVAQYAPAYQRREIQARVLDYARKTTDAEWRCNVLTLLLPSLSGPRSAVVRDDALASARRIPESRPKARALTALAVHFPEPPRTDILCEALETAAGIEQAWESAAAVMAQVATAASNTTAAGWTPFWRQVMKQASKEGRDVVATQIRHATAIIAGLGGPPLAAEALSALDDVVRWWP
jgi:hypothetical protein